MGDIKGKHRLLYIKRPGDPAFRRVGFLLVNSWNTSVGFLPTTTRNNKGYKTQRPVEKESTIAFTAVLFQDGDLAAKLGYKELREMLDLDELFTWKLEAAGESFTDVGRGHLQSLGEAADWQDSVFFEGSILNYGKPFSDVDTTPPTTPVLYSSQDPDGPSALLTWTPVTDNNLVAGYQLRKVQGSGTEIIDVGNLTSYTDTSVAYLSNYEYNVRAYDITGNYSGWSNKRLVSVPVPDGGELPDYKQYQDGTIRLTQSGVTKIWQ